MALFSGKRGKGRIKGAIKGGVKGYMTGGFAGMAVGAGVGMKRGHEEYKVGVAQDEQDKANTAMARDNVESQYTSSVSSREGIEKSFSSDVSSARAKFAASGGDLDSSSWDRVYGDLVIDRDSALKSQAASDDTFRSTESYKMFQQDFESSSANLSGKSARNSGLITKEQQGMLKKSSGSSLDTEYAGMVGPSMEEYERGQFGTDEEKASYSTMMTDRISSANKWYDTQSAANQFADKNKNQFSFGGSN